MSSLRENRCYREVHSEVIHWEVSFYIFHLTALFTLINPVKSLLNLIATCSSQVEYCRVFTIDVRKQCKCAGAIINDLV